MVTPSAVSSCPPRGLLDLGWDLPARFYGPGAYDQPTSIMRCLCIFQVHKRYYITYIVLHINLFSIGQISCTPSHSVCDPCCTEHMCPAGTHVHVQGVPLAEVEGGFTPQEQLRFYHMCRSPLYSGCKALHLTFSLSQLSCPHPRPCGHCSQVFLWAPIYWVLKK